MAIYNRDNINYGGFLQNAIANKIHNAERQAEHDKAMANLWGDTITDIGKTIGKGAFYSYSGDNASNLADAATSNTNTLDEDKAELNYWQAVREQKAADAPKGPTLQEQAAQSMFGYNPTNQSEAASHFMDNYRPNTFNDRVLTNQSDEEEQIRRMLERYERNKYNSYLQNMWRA